MCIFLPSCLIYENEIESVPKRKTLSLFLSAEGVGPFEMGSPVFCEASGVI